VFEQSILLNHEANRPWNFVASLSAELLILSLALFISLASSDHLPAFHWRSITTGPVPAPEPMPVVASSGSGTTGARPVVSVARPIFHFERAPQPPSAFSTDAPPSIGVSSVGESTNQVGKFLANMPARVPGKPPAPPPTTPSAPLRVGGTVQMAKLIRKVIPEYPSLARAARISGVVHLVGIIAKDGTIRNLQLVGGHPMLARAAMDAVEQWVYEPTLLNGEPVEVIAPIEVSFTLGR
jgi:periplasmic protein TonB